MKESYLLGLDAGTTSVKGILVRSEGKFISQYGTEYELKTSRNEICELNPEIYWRSLIKVVKRLLIASKVEPYKIKALAISSQGETLITLGKDGQVLRDAIVWLDNRSYREADIIAREFGIKKICSVSGQPEILPIWPATRILWLKRNEPKIFRMVYKYLLVEDYLIYKLTGKCYTEESMVSSSLYFDIVNKKWWSEMLKLLGISTDNLPQVLSSGQKVAQISLQAARATGLSQSTFVVSGAYDHPAGAIGAGNIESGIVSETTGASIALCVTLDKPIFSPDIKIPCQCHAVPGKYFLLPYGQTAGMVLKWFKDLFCQEELVKALRQEKDVYNLITAGARGIKPGCDGLIMLPHLMGAGSPEFNINAKGVFAGFTLSMGKSHFVRAIMESIAFMLRANLDVLSKYKIKIKEIRSLGGGARNRLWNQIKADVSGYPILTLKAEEVPALGAAILAGVGCGLFKDIAEGCRRFIKIKDRYIPDPKDKKVYQRIYKRYTDLYKAMVPFWGRN